MEIFVAKAGIESGPYTREQLPSMVESGMLALTDLVWHQGLPGWTPVHQYLGVRPPLPSPAAQDAKVIELPSHPGEPAHFGRRLGASAIDAVIWFVAGSFLSGMILTLLFGADYEQRMTPTEGTRLILIPACVLGWIYSAAMESGPWRATVGKLVFGLRVSDLDGGPISFFRACRRFSWKALMPMTLGLTLLPSLWTRRRQNVHDLLSGTVVLRK